jgi:glycine/sarcosine N-methyltransferase
MAYDSIVEYYDDIFPLKPDTLAFLQGSFPNGGRVLDLGCGSGEYVLGLARAGYRVSGLDLDEQMIARAKEKLAAAKLSAVLTVGSMCALPDYYRPGSFDGIFCIGNSLVHAQDHAELAAICRDLYSLLDEGGCLVLQVINYDRVRRQQLRGLPTIVNAARGLRFERYYEFVGQELLFTALLKVDGIEERTVNRLYAVGGDELRDCLRDAGFQDLAYYGDFQGGPFAIDSSQPLIIRCRK